MSVSCPFSLVFFCIPAMGAGALCFSVERRVVEDVLMSHLRVWLSGTLPWYPVTNRLRDFQFLLWCLQGPIWVVCLSSYFVIGRATLSLFLSFSLSLFLSFSLSFLSLFSLSLFSLLEVRQSELIHAYLILVVNVCVTITWHLHMFIQINCFFVYNQDIIPHPSSFTNHSEVLVRSVCGLPFLV